MKEKKNRNDLCETDWCNICIFFIYLGCSSRGNKVYVQLPRALTVSQLLHCFGAKSG